LAFSLRWIVGKARFTTVLSSITMNRAKHMVPRVISFILRSPANMLPPAFGYRECRGAGRAGCGPAGVMGRRLNGRS